MSSESLTVPPVGRMTPDQYDVERARLAPDKATAGIRWEQGLASLFYRSGWTQEELAKREKKSRTYITRLLIFGRFLAFVGNVPIGTNLSEGRFRAYWDRTNEDGESNERLRFRAVFDLMQAEVSLGRPHTNTGYPKRIVEHFADHKWHALPVIAKYLEADEDAVERSLYGMVKDGRGGAKTETKIVGGVKQYRFFRNARMISSAELVEKLAPIARDLEAEGRKNQVTMSVIKVAVLAAHLNKLLREWAEGPAES